MRRGNAHVRGDVRPRPVQFRRPDNAADADSCTAMLLSGDTCSPTCASGYKRNGVTSCLAGTLTSATCDPDPCDASALPANAESLGDCTATLASGSSCEPTCDLGYVASAATCFAGNLTAAACDREASCDASALPAGAADLGDCNATLPSRSSCSPTCDDGYTLAASSECVSGTLTPATCEETPKPPASVDAAAVPAKHVARVRRRRFAGETRGGAAGVRDRVRDGRRRPRGVRRREIRVREDGRRRRATETGERLPTETAATPTNSIVRRDATSNAKSSYIDVRIILLCDRGRDAALSVVFTPSC